MAASSQAHPGGAHDSAESQRTQVLEGVRHCIAAVLGLQLDEVAHDSLLTDLGADSFQFLDIVCRIETTFQVVLPANYSTPSRVSVQDLSKAVHRRLSSPSDSRQGALRASSILWSDR